MLVDPNFVVLVLAAFFFLFYAVGSYASRRKVLRIYKEISEAVLYFGGSVVSRRFGVTTAVIAGRELGALAEFTVVVGVQSWSNPLTYIISKLMRREDLAILRARMKNAPTFSVTFIRKSSPAAKYYSKWGKLIHEFDDYLVTALQTKAPFETISKIHEHLKKNKNVHLFSLREQLPHLQVYFNPCAVFELKNLLYVLEKLI